MKRPLAETVLRFEDQIDTIIHQLSQEPVKKKERRLVSFTTTTPEDFHKLQNTNHNPNVAYKLNAVKGYLMRGQKDKSGNFRWYQCCKHGHGKIGAVKCCATPLDDQSIEQRITRIQLENPVIEVTSWDAAASRRNGLQNAKQRRAYEREGIYNHVKELKNIQKSQKQKKKVNQLIRDGWNDIRASNTCCTECKKIRVKAELLEEYDNECTRTGYQLVKEKRQIRWITRCLDCVSTINFTTLGKEGPRFDNKQIDRLIRHISKSPLERRNILLQIREKSQGHCFICNIKVIRAGHSGWKQSSINDINPNIRLNNVEDGKYKHTYGKGDKFNTPIDDLVECCQACQLFQNNMSFHDTLTALCDIAEGSEILSSRSKELLHEEEIEYICRPGNKKNGSTKIVRLEIVKKCGRYCRYTGRKLSFTYNQYNSVSYDRVDSSKPYDKDQTFIVMRNINYVKMRSINESELCDWISHIIANKNLLNQRYQALITK